MSDAVTQRFGAAQGWTADAETTALVSGRARYSGDAVVEGQVHAAFLRSTVASARLRGLDTSAAVDAPGVLAVLTGREVRAAGLGELRPMASLPGSDGTPMASTPQPLLAADTIRYVGEPLAMVVATSPAAAADALALLEPEIATSPAVATIEAALAEGAPRVWPEVAGNIGLRWRAGDPEAVDRAFGRARHVTRVRLANPRLVGNPMEPRSALAWYEADPGRYTLVTPSQGVNALRLGLADMLDQDPAAVRVLTPRVGGGFGLRTPLYPEQVLVAWAARRLDRAVKWQGSRSDCFLADQHGRDSTLHGELALDGEGRFLALRAAIDANMGAYFSSSGVVVPTRNFAGGLTSVYRTGAIALEARCVFTHSVPTGPYRGAGRPEAAYLVERLVDKAARETGTDPVELRRRNLIGAAEMPWRTPMDQLYDSGEFEALMDAALERADWHGFERRRSAAAAHGRLRGRGLACFLETAGGLLHESAAVRFTEDDRIELRTAAQSNGQGHLASLAYAVAERFQIPPDVVRVVQGDSELAPAGFVSVASRSMMMAGSAAAAAADASLDKARALASHLLEVAAADLEYAGGEFRVAGTDRRIGLFDLARRAGGDNLPPAAPRELDADGSFRSPEQSFPNGCHVCEVEIDPETGRVEVVAYTAVDDCGRVINPDVVHGQIHGGIAQGLGQVLGEQGVYDASGQLLTGSFMDYPVPRADDLPALDVTLRPVPCRSNPLGVKGVGEAGTVGALPAGMNAILDALRRAGVAHLDMPATPARVWRALQEAGR
ncbi:MAG TPA: xanthine dehydrogenase family protein molybdopterin-binding subunit [Gammaproteobacteria bacterium]|nr:xanthine dehydrogenase family protein molybdopterin-binding subunit [Gammaproteobacteria bacterium]